MAPMTDFGRALVKDPAYRLMAAYSDTAFSLTGFGEAQRVEGELVASGYWRALEMRTAVGRGFGPEVDEELDAHPVAVVSDGFCGAGWARRRGVLAGMDLSLRLRASAGGQSRFPSVKLDPSTA